MKDPKKVAAGRRGAAVRQANKDRLLEELRDAKDKLRASNETTAVLPTETVTVSTKQPQPQESSVSTSGPAIVVLLAFVLGTLFVVARQRVPHSTPAPTHPTQARVSEEHSTEHKPDPFYME